MKILIVTDQFPPRQFGGMAQHAWHMASYLGKNHEVEVLTLRADQDRVAEAGEPFGVQAVLSKRFPALDFRIVARAARKFRADAVHVCTAGLMDGRLAGDIPVVTRVVGNDFLRPWCGYNLPLRSVLYRLPGKDTREAITRWEMGIRKTKVQQNLGKSEMVVANSSWTRDQLVESGLALEQIKVIVGGMDESLFSPPRNRTVLRKSMGLKEDDFVLVTAGNLIGKKNFDTVIRALAELVKKGHGNLRYFVVGDGGYQENLEQLVSSLKLSDRVVFAGRVSQSDLSKYYQAADLYVQVSVEETMGRTYFEAGGCGIPVIGARVGGVPSVIEDGKNGLLVDDPEDVEEVSGVVSQLLSDPALRAKMGAEGVKLAAEKFSWERVGNAFGELLAEVCGKEGTAAKGRYIAR